MMPTVARDNKKNRLSAERARNRDHGTPEWYTPPWLMARIAAFLGPEMYDPCPASHGRIAENGLAVPWRGKRVWINPPYGAAIMPWIRKVTLEPVREIILLVPAYTDTQWFAPLFAYTICFVRGRIRFTRMDGYTYQAPHPSVLVYRGPRYRAFGEAFRDVGPVVRPYRAYQTAQPQLLSEGASA